MGEGNNPFLAPRYDGHGEVFDYNGNEYEGKRIEALCFESAEKIAQLLADNGERGFEKLKTKIDTDNPRRSNDNIAQEAIDRLAFLRPHRQDFFHAAKCGGILPSSPSRSLDTLPNTALDDDYKPYADAVKRLLKMVSANATEEQKIHIDNMDWENWERDLIHVK